MSVEHLAESRARGTPRDLRPKIRSIQGEPFVVRKAAHQAQKTIGNAAVSGVQESLEATDPERSVARLREQAAERADNVPERTRQLGVVRGCEQADVAPVSREQLVSADTSQRDFVLAPHGLRQQPGGDRRVVGVWLVERANDRL